MTEISANLIAEVTGQKPTTARSFTALGLVDSKAPGSLTFLDQSRFVTKLSENSNIAGVFVTPSLAPIIQQKRPDIDLLITEDPRWAYYALYNRVGMRDYENKPSVIATSAKIHPTADIADTNVTIGKNTIIGPRVVILPDVHIGDDVLVQAGAVIGSEGFEIKRTSRGLLTVFHDGIVEIGNRVEIGANVCIDKGFRGRPTVIGDEARIDNLVHVAHSVRVGRRTFITAGTVLAGSVTVGDDVWMSVNTCVAPGLVIDDGAFVSIGAVVTRSVKPGQQVTGNFAVPHRDFLRMLNKRLADVK